MLESNSSLLNFHASSRLGKGTNPFNSRKPTPRRSPTFSTKSSEQIIPLSQIPEQEKKQYKLKFPLKREKRQAGPQTPQKPIIMPNPEEPQFVISDYIKKTASYYFQVIAHKYPQYKPQMKKACATFLTDFNTWMRKKGAFAQMKMNESQISPEEMESILARANEQILALSKEKKLWKDVPLGDLQNPETANLELQAKERKQQIEEEMKQIEMEIENAAQTAKKDSIYELVELLDNISMKVNTVPRTIENAIEDSRETYQEMLSDPELPVNEKMDFAHAFFVFD